MPIDVPAASHEKIAAGVWLRLIKNYNIIYRELRRRLQDSGLTFPQFEMILQLGRYEGGLPIIELSRRLLVTAGNVTGIVDRLEEKGLVTRVRQMDDRRVTKVELTERGGRLFKDIVPQHERDIGEILGVLSESELGELRGLLERLRIGLEQGGDRPKTEPLPIT